MTLIIIYFLSLIKIRILEKKIDSVIRAESIQKNILWYGVSSRIPIGDTHGVNISVQGGSADGFGLGWAMVGYSYKFNL